MKLVPTQGHNLVTGLFGASLLTSASLPSPPPISHIKPASASSGTLTLVARRMIWGRLR